MNSAPQILCNGVWDDFLYCKIGQRLLIFSYKNVDICDFSDKTRFFTRKCQFHYLGHIQILKFWLHYKQTTQRSGQWSQWLNYYIVFAVFPLNRAFYPPSDRSIIWGLIKKIKNANFEGLVYTVPRLMIPATKIWSQWLYFFSHTCGQKPLSEISQPWEMWTPTTGNLGRL